MTNYFKLGTNFDINVLESIINLNSLSSKNKISEIYGSDRYHSKLSARPGFRLPEINHYEFEEYINKAKKAGIGFNYTMNSIIPYGSKENFYEHKNEIIEFVEYLDNLDIARITIANPMMLELIRNVVGSDINIEISTIMHIDTVTQIKYLFENYRVTKICCNLNKNRDFKWLEKAAKYCNDNGIILELMANEFCGVGGGNYATHCIYRDSCYICHATNETLEDTLLFNEYPMKLCTASRNQNSSNWIKLKFIRPEDLHYYNDIGINNFKITGRTGSSKYILRTISSYLNESFDGNLLELWKPLESIKDEKTENAHSFKILNKSLGDNFLDYWAKDKHLCDNEVCGETCKYCEQFMR